MAFGIIDNKGHSIVGFVAGNNAHVAEKWRRRCDERGIVFPERQITGQYTANCPQVARVKLSIEGSNFRPTSGR